MGVEDQLLDEPVQSLDLHEYCVVSADTTVRDTISRMRASRQNCAFVVGDGLKLVGILTDRDVLKRVVTQADTWDQAVSAVMTPTPDTVQPDATAADAMRMMQSGHYRNVPVVREDGFIIGNVTYYGLLGYLTDHFPEVVFNQPPDPTNFANQRDGG